MSFDKDEFMLQRGEHPSQQVTTESFKLKASIQTYELSLKDLSALISEKLGVPAARITITGKKKDTSGPLDRIPNYIFDGITVTVKNV